MTSGKIVDSDSHVLEPADLWEKNLEPKYRSRALGIRKDEKGLEYFSIGGKMSWVFRDGALVGLGFIGKSQEWVKEHANLPYAEAATLVPGAVNPHERIKFMDSEEVDVNFIYPSLGLAWQFECEDPQLSAAYCRVYNDWVVDFCKDYPDRIIPIAEVPMRDVGEGVRELRRAAKLGMKGAFITPAPVNGIGYGDSYYDPFWATAQELEMPITLHLHLNPNYPGRYLYPNHSEPEFFSELMAHGDFIISFTNMMCEGVFERFPGLRMSMVEDGTGWIIHWLDKMDIKYEMYGLDIPLKMKPSEYFKRQIWMSFEPNEITVAATAQMVAGDRLLWGSDWPHYEGHTDAVRKMKRHIASLPENDQKKILGENALAMYGLN